MKKITNSERWLGKRKKDLNEEELKEYFKLSQRERRKRPDVQEYIKKHNREYVAKNRAEIYKKNREWQKRNPEKMKSYKNSKLKREIAVLEKALELACLSLRSKCDYCKYKDDEICPPDHHCSNLVVEYFKEQAKENIKNDCKC